MFSEYSARFMVSVPRRASHGVFHPRRGCTPTLAGEENRRYSMQYPVLNLTSEKLVVYSSKARMKLGSSNGVFAGDGVPGFSS